MSEPGDPEVYGAEPGSVRLSSLALGHVADHPTCHPGEDITFHTRVDAHGTLPGFSLRVEIPEGSTLVSESCTYGGAGETPRLVLLDGVRWMLWQQQREISAGERFEFGLVVRVDPSGSDLTLHSRALAVSQDGDIVHTADETATVAVRAQSAYMQYLPAVYAEQDEFMGRFLMLFESFWAPIMRQIDQMHYYFDPRLVPSALLPYLATWVDLSLDERWPEERRRQALRAAVAHYRTRGTKPGLAKQLEMYAGTRPVIAEHRTGELRLGPDARLGLGSALVSGNAPGTFTVSLDVPPDPQECKAIQALIEAAKPAHAGYALKMRG